MARSHRICSIDGCGKEVNVRGWCSSHYQRWLRHGDPLGVRPLRGEAPAFLDAAVSYSGDECLLWPYAAVRGYGQIRINGKLYLVSRVVCERAHGPAPTPRHEAAHSCGRGHEGCITPNHLRWATPVENQADKVRHGTHNRGEQCPVAKLTEADVRQIRALQGHVSQREIGERFGVDQSNISHILRGKSWRTV